MPILLHQGRRPWSAPRELGALLALDASAASAVLRPLQPAFRPIVVSLADWSTQRVRGMAITVFAKLVLEALQRLPGASTEQSSRRSAAGVT